MNEQVKKWLAYAIVIIAVVVAGYLGVSYPLPAPPTGIGAQSIAGEGITTLDSLTLTNDLVVTDDASVTGDLTAGTGTFATGATVTSGGLLITAGGLTVSSGDADLAGLFQPSFANETITDGEVLTPTVTVYALDTAGAVTMTLAASADEGQLLILIGDDANTITINDTNIRSSDGSTIDVGQYDVVVFVYQDSEWLELLLIADS